MTIFIIVLAIILLIVSVILISKVSVFLSFHGEFRFSVSFSGFTVYDSSKQKANEEKPEKQPPKKEAEKENFFKKLQKKKGFTGAIKEIAGLASFAIKKLARLLKHFSFRKVFLDITVATESAADTAIQYGAVCSVVYPVAQFLNSVTDVKFRNINVSTDYNSKNPEIEFEFKVSVRAWYLLMFAFGIYKEYRNFISRNDLE